MTLYNALLYTYTYVLNLYWNIVTRVIKTLKSCLMLFFAQCRISTLFHFPLFDSLTNFMGTYLGGLPCRYC